MPNDMSPSTTPHYMDEDHMFDTSDDYNPLRMRNPPSSDPVNDYVQGRLPSEVLAISDAIVQRTMLRCAAFWRDHKAKQEEAK